MLTYQKRNLENIDKLADHTKAIALKWHEYLVQNKIDILIYSTIRTKAQQEENVRKGVSQTMKSYHIVGQALDFVRIQNGDEDWDGYNKPDIKKAIAEAKRLGFEWGGDWKSFVDKPHLQFNFNGYGTDTFGKYKEPKPVEKPKVELKPAEKPVEKPKVEKPKVKADTKKDKLEYKRILKNGCEGQDVKNLQNALNKLNFKCGVADGKFLDKTEDAVIRFQKVYLPSEVDGMVGNHFIDAINKKL
jgi:peptidoglycan L-alanyl-D-glutamate endopeptidase CwlK